MGNLKSDPPRAITLAPRETAPRSEDKALQRLWLALTKREWKSLASLRRTGPDLAGTLLGRDERRQHHHGGRQPENEMSHGQSDRVTIG